MNTANAVSSERIEGSAMAVTYYLVVPSEHLTRPESDRYLEVKSRVLGYMGGDARVPSNGVINLVGLGFGAVKDQEDADQLAEELSKEFPHYSFRVEEKERDDCDAITWYENR
jgi:hypothetical protein